MANLDKGPNEMQDIVHKFALQHVIDGGVNHFITITIPPRYYRRTAMNQFKATKPTIKNILNSFFRTAIVVAELTERGNIHYHILGNFKEHEGSQRVYKIGFIDSLKKFARTDCQIAKQPMVAMRYLTKDLNVTAPIIEDLPYILHKERATGTPHTVMEILQEASPDLDIEESTISIRTINLMEF